MWASRAVPEYVRVDGGLGHCLMERIETLDIVKSLVRDSKLPQKKARFNMHVRCEEC